ncbi:MAG: trypsin-like peptidase domain-containing protein [Actinomycetota bacterium]|nr:trypsin-like peptidase domain-containing protein [Actinomycetota bacterium]
MTEGLPPWTGEQPVRPPWLDDEPTTGPMPGPVFVPDAYAPPALPAPPAPQAGTSWWKPALLGGLVGALVAAPVALGVAAALDDDPAPAPASAVPVAGSNLELRGEPLDIQGVLGVVQPGVVSIDTELTTTGPFGNPQRGQAAGSGMVIEADGTVLTNAHVIEGATSITVNLADGRSAEADLLGSIPSSDVALVRIKDVEALDTVTFGSSTDLRVGDDVVAVGNALNLTGTPTVTTGIVSAKDRSVETETGVVLDSLVQTDAAINQGNSGGPLVDATGKVIGVNTAIAGGAENIGFAIAIDALKPLIERIKAGDGDLGARPFLGVSTADLSGVNPDVLQNLGVSRTDGAFVAEVTPGSGAAEAGLETGDVILSIDGERVRTTADVGRVVAGGDPGDTVEIGYERNGEERTVTATLGSTAEDQGG